MNVLCIYACKQENIQKLHKNIFYKKHKKKTAPS